MLRLEGKGGGYFYLQSTSRLARESAENPPNTTLWMAPMRAHASIEIGSASTAGMYSATALPYKVTKEMKLCQKRRQSSFLNASQ